MRKAMGKGWSAVVAVFFAVSVVLLVSRICDDQKAAAANQAARELITTTVPSAPESTPEPVAEADPPDAHPDPREVSELPDSPVPLKPIPAEKGNGLEPLSEESLFLLDLDLSALHQTSEHALGWIYIPGTVVDYPLMAFDDNETGLHRAWDGSVSGAGCIFLECRNQRDFSDFNTLIYGHRIRKGTMFGSLKHYAEQEYLQSHSLIYIVTDDYVRRYEVFSAYEATVASDTYRLHFENDERKQSVLDYYLSSSVVETGITPTTDDRILTLSTCTGRGSATRRWVVQAVLTGEFEK